MSQSALFVKENSGTEPLRGQPFNPDQHAVITRWAVRHRRAGRRVEITTDHEAFPEMLEVTPEGAGQPRFMLYRSMGGRFAVDDMGSSEPRWVRHGRGHRLTTAPFRSQSFDTLTAALRVTTTPQDMREGRVLTAADRTALGAWRERWHRFGVVAETTTEHETYHEAVTIAPGADCGDRFLVFRDRSDRIVVQDYGTPESGDDITETGFRTMQNALASISSALYKTLHDIEGKPAP